MRAQRSPQNSFEKEARTLSVEFKQKANIMDESSPTQCETPTIVDSPLIFNPLWDLTPINEHVVRNLFGPNPDPEWAQKTTKNAATDIPNIPLPKGYDPEAARQRIRAVGYRYHPPETPVKETIRKEVEWTDFLIDP